MFWKLESQFSAATPPQVRFHTWKASEATPISTLKLKTVRSKRKKQQMCKTCALYYPRYVFVIQ